MSSGVRVGRPGVWHQAPPSPCPASGYEKSQASVLCRSPCGEKDSEWISYAEWTLKQPRLPCLEQTRPCSACTSWLSPEAAYLKKGRYWSEESQVVPRIPFLSPSLWRIVCYRGASGVKSTVYSLFPHSQSPHGISQP